MNYIESSLIGDEKVIYTGKPSIWAFSLAVLLSTLFVFVYGLGILLLLFIYFHYKSIELAFTDRRVIAKYGLISRSTVELNISKIESIQVTQSIIGRIFNYGDIVISGAGNPQAPIIAVSEPMKFRKALLEYQDEIKKKAG